MAVFALVRVDVLAGDQVGKTVKNLAEQDDGFDTRWGEMAGRELVAFTRQMFPLSDQREDTFIGGLSMGGFGALRLGSYYHETFSRIFCLSGAFVIDDIAGIKEGYSDDIGDYDCYHHIFGDLEQLKGAPVTRSGAPGRRSGREMSRRCIWLAGVMTFCWRRTAR